MLTGCKNILCSLIFIGLLIYPISHAHTADKEIPKAAQPLISPDEMMVHLEEVLASERNEHADLKEQLKALEADQDALRSEIEIYNFQNTVQDQLLLATQPQIEDLEDAIDVNLREGRALNQRVDRFQKQWDRTSVVARQTADRIDMAQEDLAEIRDSQFSDIPKLQLEAATQKVIDVLIEKKGLSERFQKIHADLLWQIEAARDAKKALGEKLAARLESQKRSSLFQRFLPYLELNSETIQKELQFFRSRIQAVFSIATWKVQWDKIKKDRFDLWVIFLAALVAILTVMGRCRNALKRVEERCDRPGYYYRRLALLLLRHSLPYIGLTLLLWFYRFLPFLFHNVGIGRVLFKILLLLLATRLGLDFLKYGLGGPIKGWHLFVVQHLKRFFRFSRVAIIMVFLLTWAVGLNSVLAWMAQSGLIVVILLWSIVFWRQIKPVVAKSGREGKAGPNLKWMALYQGWSYLVIGGSLFFNLLGYSILAGQWLKSWTETVVLLFCGLVGYNVIREFQRENQAKIAAAEETHSIISAQQMRWSLIRVVWAIWFLGLVFMIFRSWDPSGILGTRFRYFFELPFTIGNIELSVEAMVNALIILYITQLAVSMGRALIREKILDKRSYEIGFKDSIVTIMGYLGWGVGLLIALAVIGFNATSLALVFGALSVGIGFGLQAIFNNFMSGLILLFERPIQVGDYIEIDGMWAEVRKINVRATVVQTFDNASVIIPNSEFISKQVTNWSFKDKRMRRNIEVGVAYGSDIDLVQTTMLDIAKAHPKVLKHPKPEVLFMDHADSALVFRLRIWAHVDNYWTVSSDIRCELDRRFRELGIEIAFPQRDVHIRTIQKEIGPAEAMVDMESTSPNQHTEKKED